MRDLYEPADGARVMSRALTGLGVIACLCAARRRPGVGPVRLARRAAGARRCSAPRAGPARAALARDRAAAQPRRDCGRRRCCATGPMVAAPSDLPRLGLLGAAPTAACSASSPARPSSSSSVLGARRRRSTACDAARVSLAYIAGTFLCRRLLLRHGVRGAVARGAGFTLAGGARMALLALAGVHTVWAILLPLYAVHDRPRRAPALRPDRRGRSVSRRRPDRGLGARASS